MKKYLVGLVALCCVFGCRQQYEQPANTPERPPTVIPPPPSPPPILREAVYEGTWVTTNRRLDGTMKCVVSNVGDEKWEGQFSGNWQGQKFSYKVVWTGPQNKFVGTADIGGANYQWFGSVGDDGIFRGTFTGNRYKGHFELSRHDP